jgi:uncharacterized membrane protein YcaP (DUF421 family)
MKEIFEWNRILLNDLPVEFLLEVIFRCVIMFILVLLTLKLAGRRGVRQLSIFELVIIITLGSAAGDPMFYEDVGILHAVCVFVVVLLMYRFITWAISRFQKVDDFLEGKPIYLIKESVFSVDNFEKENIVIDEFFSELRQQSVDHLGQVRLVILETSGDISIFYFEDDKVKYGLPILPHEFENCFNVITEEQIYSCTFCGTTQRLSPREQIKCENCKRDKWVYARNNKRIT